MMVLYEKFCDYTLQKSSKIGSFAIILRKTFCLSDLMLFLDETTDKLSPM